MTGVLATRRRKASADSPDCRSRGRTRSSSRRSDCSMRMLPTVPCPAGLGALELVCQRAGVAVEDAGGHRALALPSRGEAPNRWTGRAPPGRGGRCCRPLCRLSGFPSTGQRLGRMAGLDLAGDRRYRRSGGGQCAHRAPTAHLGGCRAPRSEERLEPAPPSARGTTCNITSAPAGGRGSRTCLPGIGHRAAAGGA